MTRQSTRWLARMKRRGFLTIAFALSALLLVAPAPAQHESGAISPSAFPPAPEKPPENPTPAVQPMNLTDLAWLQGQWIGAWGPRTATQTWSAPKAGAILGTLQIVADNETTVVEFVTISQAPQGVIYRLLHFTPSLALWEKGGPAVLSLMSSDTRKFVFQNQGETQPQQIVLTRVDPDTYVDRSEIVPDSGDRQITEITFHRQKPSVGSAGRR
jgi:hypothetical protein